MHIKAPETGYFGGFNVHRKLQTLPSRQKNYVLLRLGSFCRSRYCVGVSPKFFLNALVKFGVSL